MAQVMFSMSNREVTKEGQSIHRSMLASHTKDTLWVVVYMGSSKALLSRIPIATPRPKYAAHMWTRMDPPGSVAKSPNMERLANRYSTRE